MDVFLLSFEGAIASVADDGVVFAYVPVMFRVFLSHSFSTVFAVNLSFLTDFQMIRHVLSLDHLWTKLTLLVNILTSLFMKCNFLLIEFSSTIHISYTLD